MLTSVVRAILARSSSWTKARLDVRLCSSTKLFAMQEVTAKMQDSTIDGQKTGDQPRRGKKKEDKFVLKTAKVSVVEMFLW